MHTLLLKFQEPPLLLLTALHSRRSVKPELCLALNMAANRHAASNNSHDSAISGYDFTQFTVSNICGIVYRQSVAQIGQDVG